MLVAAYFRATGTLLLIGVAWLTATIIVSKTSARACALDRSVLAVGVYEIVSLWTTTYPANSVWYAEIVEFAVLVYLLIRLAIGTAWQVLVIAGAIGITFHFDDYSPFNNPAGHLAVDILQGHMPGVCLDPAWH